HIYQSLFSFVYLDKPSIIHLPYQPTFHSASNSLPASPPVVSSVAVEGGETYRFVGCPLSTTIQSINFLLSRAKAERDEPEGKELPHTAPLSDLRETVLRC